MAADERVKVALPEDAKKRLDKKAKRLGISREELLRRFVVACLDAENVEWGAHRVGPKVGPILGPSVGPKVGPDGPQPQQAESFTETMGPEISQEIPLPLCTPPLVLSSLNTREDEDKETSPPRTPPPLPKLETRPPTSRRPRQERPTPPASLSLIPGFTELWQKRILALAAGKRPSPAGEEIQFKVLCRFQQNYGNEKVLEAVEEAINCGWTGLRYDWIEDRLCRPQVQQRLTGAAAVAAPSTKQATRYKYFNEKPGPSSTSRS